jgi:hypothetical protein
MNLIHLLKRKIQHHIKLLLLLILTVLAIFLFIHGQKELFINIDDQQEFSTQVKVCFYEEIDAYRVLYKGIYDKEDFIKGNKDINNFRLVKIRKSHEKPHTSASKKLSEPETGELLNFLYSNQAFLVDLDLFTQLTSTNSEIDSTILQTDKVNKIKRYKKLDELIDNKSNKKLFMSFGIVYESVYQLKEIGAEYSKSSFSFKCEFKRASTLIRDFVAENETVLTGFYLSCKDLLVHLALFYKRGDFHWVSNDDYFHGGVKTTFGDKARAFKKLD